MSSQLELPLTASSDRAWVDRALRIARMAVDTNVATGRSYFTTGAVRISGHGQNHILLATDTRWAASIIRTALLDTGHAIDADRDNQSTTVTVWAVRETGTAPVPLLSIADESTEPTRPGFVLSGPDGAVEQQCGAGGHNHMVAHARHPFHGSARAACHRHGNSCWQRWAWPLGERARHLLASSWTTAGAAIWCLTPQAEERMRAVYVNHIHPTRPE